MQRIILLLLNFSVSFVNCNLNLNQFDEGQLEGSYSDATTGTGINFKSGKNFLEISTTSGQTLVSSVRDAATLMTASIIGGKGFISYDGEDIAVSVETVAKVRNMPSIDEKIMLFSELSQREQGGNDFTSEEMKQGIINIVQEKDLLINAAYALGAKGITSKNYQPALLLYKFASKLVESLHRLNYTNKMLFDNRNKLRDDEDDCLEYCPPCPEQECLGMCGPGCTCWSMVCGDCCYHLGCYDHDVCCREKFFQLRCLIPYGFACEENYYCKN